MKAELSTVRWGRVLFSGIAAPFLSMAVIFVVVTVSAARLAIQAKGQRTNIVSISLLIR